jgi:glutamate-5-semialdehyde dehydrogenase
VIIRGSGPTTRELSMRAATHGVRTLAHADGGGVLYADYGADAAMFSRLLRQSLDRLGVCNRLNLLLIHRDRWDDLVPAAERELAELGIALEHPPHGHALGHEWALDDGNEAHVTLERVGSPVEAAMIANDETSGLAAGIVTDDAASAVQFLDAYVGTGAFWNTPTRLLDGFKLLGAPETGINVDHVPGPRGPVTFQDLYLRQYVVMPADKISADPDTR